MKIFKVISLFFALIKCSELKKVRKDYTIRETSPVKNSNQNNLSLGDCLFAYVFAMMFTYIIIALFIGIAILIGGFMWIYG